MATKYYLFSGKARWAKPHKLDPEFKNWSIQVQLDKSSKEAFDESGLRLQESKDGEGYITFRRPETKQINDKLVKFAPPAVWAKDGTAFAGLIGNGSEVTVKVAVFDTRKGKGHRWEAVKVDNLVEYNPPVKGGDAATAATGGAALPF